jgi:CMP-N-acetylneuraminic acid synthetase
VLRHIVKKAQNFNNNEISYIVDLDVTNPCRTVADLEKCRKLFEENEYKTLFSATETDGNPYFNQVELIEGKIVLSAKAAALSMAIRGTYNFIDFTRRQDAPAVYKVNSNIYFYDTEWLREDKTNFVITDKSGIYPMPRRSRHDIDDEDSFFDAENNHRKYYLGDK